MVPKLGPAEWQFTVDLSPFNKFTIPFQFPMPVIEHEVIKTAKSRVVAGVISPDGVFTPTRVLHGTTNVVLQIQYFQSTKLPPELRE